MRSFEGAEFTSLFPASTFLLAIDYLHISLLLLFFINFNVLVPPGVWSSQIEILICISKVNLKNHLIKNAVQKDWPDQDRPIFQVLFFYIS